MRRAGCRASVKDEGDSPKLQRPSVKEKGVFVREGKGVLGNEKAGIVFPKRVQREKDASARQEAFSQIFAGAVGERSGSWYGVAVRVKF